MGRLVYLFVHFVGNIQTSPNKKKVSHVNIFSAKMTGIYVITYKAGGFYAKNGHFCDYIQRKGGFCKKHAMLAPDGRAPPVRFGVSAG